MQHGKRSVCLRVCLAFCLSISLCLSLPLSACLSGYLAFCLSISLCVSLSLSLSLSDFLLAYHPCSLTLYPASVFTPTAWLDERSPADVWGLEKPLWSSDPGRQNEGRAGEVCWGADMQLGVGGFGTYETLTITRLFLSGLLLFIFGQTLHCRRLNALNINGM